MSNKQCTYALYKGDTLLSIGTVKELTEEFGIHEETIAYYASPTYRKRTSAQKGRRLIKIEDDK